MVAISARHRNIRKESIIKGSFRLRVVLIVALLAGIAALFIPYHTARDCILVLPGELEGIWRCDDTRYRDRFLRLSPSIVALGIGDRQMFVHSIKRAEHQKIDNRTLYTIYYNDKEGLEQKMAFYYDASGEGTLYFKHQPHITWHKSWAR